MEWHIMIQINIAGTNNKSQDLIRNCVSYFCHALMHGNTVNSLFIDIEVTRNLSGKEGIMGDISNEGYTTRPRDFTLRICSSLDRDTIIKTIAHECVHIKQYVRGELKEPSLGRWVWKNHSYNCDFVDYWELPWEVEAHAMEDELADKYLRTIK